MKTFTKILISISSSIIIFTALAFIAFSSGFNLIENNFYNNKVSREVLLSLEKSVLLLEETHKNNIRTINEVLNDEYVSNVFDSRYTDTQIIERDRVFKTLNRKLKGFDSIRVISLDGKKLQYSNLASDVRTQDENRRVYKNINQIESDTFFDEIKLSDDLEYRIDYIEESNQFRYILPFIDQYDQKQGFALFYVSSSGYRYFVSQNGLASSSEETFIVGSGGILFNLTRNQFKVVKDEVNRFWNKEDPLKQVYLSQSDDESFILFTEYIKGIGAVGRVVPASDLTLSNYMKFLLLGTLFVLIILINFLIFNIRQDKSVILSHRIKRFQIKFLQDYVENKGDLDWKTWQKEIQSRKKQVHNELLKNLGAYGKKHKDQVENLINSSWDDIIEVISSKVPKEDTQEKVHVDAEQIEDILERVLARGVKVKGFEDGVAVPSTGVIAQKPKSKGPSSEFAGMEPVEVEELDELEDGDDFGGMEPVEVEELDELEGGEDFGGMEPVEVEELDELEDGDDFGGMEPVEVEELDELEDGDDFGGMKPVEVEELDELEDGDDFGGMEPVEVEELDELKGGEDIGGMEPVEVEDLDELEGGEDFGGMEPVEVEALEDFDDNPHDQEVLGDNAQELEELDDNVQELEEIDVNAQELEELDDNVQELEELDDNVQELEELDDNVQELEELDDNAQELEELDVNVQELEELDEVQDIYMFESPDEQEKRYRDAIEMSEQTAEDFVSIPIDVLLKEILGDDYSLLEKEEVKADEKVNDDYGDSIVTVQDFDLNLFSDQSEQYYHIEKDAFGSYGYNLDLYMHQFPGTSSKLYKGMLKITKDFDTHAGALIMGDKVVVNLAVNMSFVEKIVHKINSGSFGNILEQRDVVVLKVNNSKLYKDIFENEENFKELVLLPVKYEQDKSCYLILFYTELKKDIINYIKALK